MYDIYQQSALGVKKCKVNSLLRSRRYADRGLHTDPDHASAAGHGLFRAGKPAGRLP